MFRILTIEDEQTIREDICDLLELEGFETMGAENGLKGLEAIYECAPNLVICDVRMPEIDGYEVLKKVRQDPSYQCLPIILISAETSASVQIGLELGANAYLSKPFTPSELMQTVREILD